MRFAATGPIGEIFEQSLLLASRREMNDDAIVFATMDRISFLVVGTTLVLLLAAI